MAIEVKVPSLGESITSGVIASWNAKDGDYVEKNQVIYELETDKITSEGVAEASGVIRHKAAEGDEVEIGQVIAEIDEEAEAPEKASEAEKQEKPRDEPEGRKKAEEAQAAQETEAPEKAKGDEAKEEPSEAKEEKEEKEETPPLSPAARRAASETGVDPATVSGTGKGGRVTKGDLIQATESRGGASDEPKAPVPEPSKGEGEQAERRTERRKLSPMRRKIADRLVAAQREAAMLTTFNEADLSAIKKLRAERQEAFVAKHDVKLGFMSFFVKAVVRAIKEVPAINARIEGDELVQNHYYDIGIAVSTTKGLLVPVVRDCDALGMADIERRIAAFAKKAREGKISLEDIQGGVFTITNGGIFGSLLSTPILNAPQSAILGMHAIQDRPVAVDGQVAIRPMMYLALSYDHRIIDGSEAVTFLVKVKEAVEDPVRLLLDV